MAIIKTLKFGVILTDEQKKKFNKVMGCSRFIYNAYIEENERRYKEGEPFLNDRKFRDSKMKELVAEHDWLKDCPKHPLAYVLTNAYNQYKRFFDNPGPVGKPRFRSKYRNPIVTYSVDNEKVKLKVDDGTVRISHFHELIICKRELKRLKNQRFGKLWRCKLIRDTVGNFYIAMTIEDPTWDMLEGKIGTSRAIGIDMGLVKYATISDGRVFDNPCRTNSRYRHADRMIRRLSRVIARKAIARKSQGFEGRDVYHSKKQEILWDRIRKYYRIRSNIIKSYIRQLCHDIVSVRPVYINIEKLMIRTMVQGKSRRLRREIIDACL